jgi:hypothetical protein
MLPCRTNYCVVASATTAVAFFFTSFRLVVNCSFALWILTFYCGTIRLLAPLTRRRSGTLGAIREAAVVELGDGGLFHPWDVRLVVEFSSYCSTHNANWYASSILTSRIVRSSFLMSSHRPAL